MNKQAPTILYFLLFVGFLISFLYSSIPYSFTFDDAFSLATLKVFGFKKAWWYYYQNVNGRWLSHFFLLAAFQFCSYSFLLYSLMSICLLLFSIFLIAVLIKPIQDSFKLKYFMQAGMYFSLLYFALYPGKFECFFWMNSIFMHWLGIIFILACLVLLKYQVKLLFAFPVFFMCGGFNEINALCFAFLLFTFSFLKKHQAIRVKLIVCAALILIGLSLNFISGGIATRLDLLPDFQFLQAFKNSLHSILVMAIGHFSLEQTIINLGALVLIWVIAKQERPEFGLMETILLILCAVFSVFLTCFVLSDIAPYRSLLLPTGIALTALLKTEIFNGKMQAQN